MVNNGLYDALTWLLYGYCVMSLLSLLLYGKDKWAAKRQGWRVPERTLHFIAVLGGWPGAILAQKLFRHKTKKQYFRYWFWFTVLMNIIMCVGLFTWQFKSSLFHAYF